MDYTDTILDGDILLVSLRLSPFYYIKDALFLPYDVVRLKFPRLLSNFISSRIQKSTLSLWNHVELLFWDKGILKTAGAQSKGVRIANFEEEFPKSKYRIMILRPKKPVTDEQRKQIIEFVKEAANKVPYGYKDMLKIKWYLLTGGLDKLNKMSKESTDFSPMICSQFVDRCWSIIEDILPYTYGYPVPGSFDISDKLVTIYTFL